MHISRNLLNVPTKTSKVTLTYYTTGVSSLEIPGILADQLTLFQLGGIGYVHLITTGTPGFSDLPTALYYKGISKMPLPKGQNDNEVVKNRDFPSKITWLIL